jgi:ketosteroid isomerase-like protein
MLRRKPRSKSHRKLAAAILCLSLVCAIPARTVLAQSDPQSNSSPTLPNSQPAPLPNPPPDQSNPLHTASRTELDVVKVLLAQEHAWNLGDVAGYVRAYKDSPDTLFIDKQVTKGFHNILEDYEHNYTTRSSMGTLVFSELEVYPVADTVAICTGRYHLDRGKKDGGPAEGLFSLILEKTPDGWKIVLDHTT